MTATLTDTGTPVLSLLDVAKEYPGSPPVRAVDGVSLDVFERELLAIVGQSGSGKSTLMNLIGTLDRPTEGRVHIDGHQISTLSDAGLAGLRSARIGFVFQQFHLLEAVSAIDNVATGLLYRGHRRGKRRARSVAEAVRRTCRAHQRQGHHGWSADR